ncbi:DHA2 family efflux MFS transporter permease subunit [Flavihumibacter petaseus]|uniref:Putative multidrug efflux pump membrane protein n=1 Tax=Flavihumibacter petaseus NBRC 106054 TaxID=1220578 RepID=A0A0E9MZT4_9BACT|nr:DHA2 family efflux MFS transporter permease subunit [Flavihumibacter petaseus]GAO42640.1 putative multidrug efflux pump membrane protein [Flavihumibacter petaseus NBRC 106054]
MQASNRTMVLVTLMIGTSMAAIDSSIVNVSLPVIQKQFDVLLDAVALVVTAYMITYSLFIPLTSWLKNRIGYYWLYMGSICIFTIGSLLCSLSTSLTFLILARVLQAVGGGAIAPTSLAILSDSFPKEERGSAIGWWGIGNVMGPALGPTLGGVLTQYLGWESIFYVNVPIGIITLSMARKNLSFLKTYPTTRPRFDTTGYLLLAGFILLLQATIIPFASRFGVLSWQFLGSLAITVTAFLLYLRSAKRPDPLMDLSIFRIAGFNRCFTIVGIRSLALFGGMFFLPFLLQGYLGYTEMESALLLLPNALIMLVTRPVSGRLADRGLIRNISIMGILLLSLSFVFFSRIDQGTAVAFIITAMIIRGLGISFLIAPVSTAMLNAVTAEQTPTATSLNTLMLQLGGSIGIAISSALHTHLLAHYLERGLATRLAEHFSLMDGFLVTAGIILLALVPAFRLPQRTRKRLKSKEVLG